MTPSPTNHRHANSWKFENQFFLTLTKKLSEWAIKFNRLFWDSGVHRDIVHTSHVIIAYTLYPPPKKKKQKKKKKTTTTKKQPNHPPPQKKKKKQQRKTKNKNKTKLKSGVISSGWADVENPYRLPRWWYVYIYMSSCWHHILTISLAIYRKLPGGR